MPPKGQRLVDQRVPVCCQCRKDGSQVKIKRSYQYPNRWQSYCAECLAVNRKDYRQRHIVAIAEQTKRRNQAVKAEAFAKYGGPICVGCGEMEDCCLSLDHIEQNGAAHRRALGAKDFGGPTFYCWLRKRNWPPGYRVLCMNCQWRARAGVPFPKSKGECMKIVLGLSGKAEHGKTEVARSLKLYVETVYSKPAEIFEISEMIRLEAVRQGRLPADVKRPDMTPAQIKVLVDIGNEERAKDPEHWSKDLQRAMDESDAFLVMCPNIRFQQEIDAIHNLRGHVVRINRYNPDMSLFISTTRNPNDVTETALDTAKFDFLLANLSGHVALLDELALTLLEYIIGLEEARD